jgi:hypothetical protein
MLHFHVISACSSPAARTWTRSVNLDMQHEQGDA